MKKRITLYWLYCFFAVSLVCTVAIPIACVYLSLEFTPLFVFLIFGEMLSVFGMRISSDLVDILEGTFHG
jgi:hypothetical protein